MFERYTININIHGILIHICFSKNKKIEDLQEFTTLVSSAKIKILQIIKGNRKKPYHKYFVGKGKALEIANAVKTTKASLVLFNHILTPAQERNLETLFNCRVFDRNSLILNIFEKRAHTHEGKLQVELAQLRYLATRLVHGWSHLERHGMRGPGEMQLEIDRRLLRKRINQVLKNLKYVEKNREQKRLSRIKANVPTVSLIGYTNAGKSTLLNKITSAKVYVANQLFSTLDPTTRYIDLNDVGKVILTDTVGFIRNLPYDLIAGFKATLKEISEATLLLHIIDANNIQIDEHIQAVNKILKEINANKIPILLAMNKIDLLNNSKPRIYRDKTNKPICVWFSAKTGEGISLLYQALSERLSNRMVQYDLCLPAEKAGKLRSKFYQAHAIKKEWNQQDGSIGIRVRIPVITWYRLCKQEVLLNKYLI